MDENKKALRNEAKIILLRVFLWICVILSLVGGIAMALVVLWIMFTDEPSGEDIFFKILFVTSIILILLAPIGSIACLKPLSAQITDK